MFAKLYVEYDGVTPWDPVAYVSDIVAVMCGETNPANLSLLTFGTSGEITDTVPGGWTLENQWGDGSSNYWVLSAPCPEDNSYRDYLKVRHVISNDEIFFMIGNQYDGDQGVTYKKNNQAVYMGGADYNLIKAYPTSSYETYVSASANHFGIWQRKSSSLWVLFFRRTRELAHDTLENGFCAWGGIHSSDNSNRGEPIQFFDMPYPLPTTDDPTQYLTGASTTYVPGNYIGVMPMTGTSWQLETCQWQQDDDTYETAFFTPIVGTYCFRFGQMRPEVPIKALSSVTDSPVSSHGTYVVLDGKRYMSVPAYDFWWNHTDAFFYLEKI